MKINVRKLVKIRALLRTLALLFFCSFLGFAAVSLFLDIKSDLEAIHTMQIIQLELIKEEM